MNNKLVLLVGCGDLGTRCGNLLLSEGWRVAAVRRDPEQLPAEFNSYAADYSQSGSLDFARDLQPYAVLATFNPSSRSVEGYRQGFAHAMSNLLRGLGNHQPHIVLMASSTRVYGERNGGWVDESSELATEDERALAIIEAENLLLDSALPASVVRFGGIYGASNGRLIQRIREGRICAAKPLRYSNRIHRDDCAGFLTHLLQRKDREERPAPVYTAVDDAPVAQYEVESWLARQLDITSLTSSSNIPERAAGHKRCRNSRLHSSGYRLLYPDYRSGYQRVLGT